MAGRSDTDRDHLVDIGVQGPQDATRANTGDVMLTTAATKNHRDANPVHV